MDGNYIKISRSILEWEWYGNINTCRLFLHMLLKANWKDGRFEGKDIPRGSFVSSYPRLADECGLTVNEVRTALKHLISTGEITVKAHAKYSVFTVVKYNDYQEVNSQGTDKSHSINRRLTTIEEGKKERREEYIPPISPSDRFFESEKLNHTFLDYVDFRKKMRKPMTDRAIQLAVGKLKTLASGSGEFKEDEAIEILNNSIVNGWQGLFPLKNTKEIKNTNKFNDFPQRDYDMDSLEAQLLGGKKEVDKNADDR